MLAQMPRTERVLGEGFVLTRRRTLSSPSLEEVCALLAYLREEKFTGQIQVDMSQGGLCQVRAEDGTRMG